jgi:hypothetical protein
MYNLANYLLYWTVRISIVVLTILTAACAPQVQYNRPGIVGPAGPAGETGPRGSDGIDGQGCTVTTAYGGALISCGDGASTVVLNGINGTNGQDAPPTAYTVTEIIDPCGKQTAFDEVLLRLANGQLIAHFANGANQFLTIVGQGSYSSTDGTHCFFTVTADGEVVNEHN